MDTSLSLSSAIVRRGDCRIMSAYTIIGLLRGGPRGGVPLTFPNVS